jgi:hypothetical protein
MSVPVAEATVSPEEGAPSIVSGLLVDDGGQPTPGSVEVFAWPTGRPVEVGETIQLTPVGHDRTTGDGRFSVGADLTPELAHLADLNGGYVNLVLQAVSAGVIEETHFSRYVGNARFSAQEASPRPAEWRASPDEAAEPVRVTFAAAPASARSSEDRRIAPMQGGCWNTKLVESQVGNTVIGELRTPDDTLEAFFAYGQRADSEIGVVSRGSQGPWAGSGSFHIANSENTEITQRAGSGKHLLVRTRFMYDRYEYTCGAGLRQKVVPREWMGDVQSEPTAVRGCAGAPEGRLGRFTGDTDFFRDREKAVRWEGAASVFGASLTARSGYSRWVRGFWKFGAGPMHLLCGNDGPPKRAGHIFAGTSA